METQRDLLQRLSALNHGPLRTLPEPSSEIEGLRRKLWATEPDPKGPPHGRRNPDGPSPIVYRRDLPRYEPDFGSSFTSGAPLLLDDAVRGGETTKDGWGSAFVSVCPAADLCADGAALATELSEKLLRAGGTLRGRLAALCGGTEVAVEDLLFIDVETTGLGNSPVFLSGLMAWEGEALVIRQFLARDYSEEAAMTAMLVEYTAGRKLAVSFNGKSFDLPYLRMRAAANRVPFPWAPAHLDLLHESRRAWRGQVPDCRLQTLERLICGRARSGDIPGHRIPDAYHAFVRTGDATEIAQIVRHNRYDLLTLGELLLKLPPPPERER